MSRDLGYKCWPSTKHLVCVSSMGIGLEVELGGCSMMRVHEGAEWLRLRHCIQGRA